MTQVENSTLLELAGALANRFVMRRDLYGKQTDFGYLSIKEPLTDKLLISHLQGQITLGTYVLDADSHSRLMVLDGDDDPEKRSLKAIGAVLAEMGCPTYFEASRRGGHLWFFFEESLPGHTIRTFGQGLLNVFNAPTIELFPKQDALGDGPGSLIRLPFGVHRKSGRRYGFYQLDGPPLAPSLREQIRLLATPAFVPQRLLAFYAAHADRPVEQPAADPNADRQPLESGLSFENSDLDRLKAIPLRSFVAPHVRLDRYGRGLCPFHDDTVPSFSLSDERNAWHCFAGCGGGSIIDFYIVQQQRLGREIDFRTALQELASQLL